MSNAGILDGEPADTHEAIMFATFSALRKHGYSGLSISRIADESELTKSTFYHHFDGKDDILASFVTYMREYFARGFEIESTGDPVEDLDAFVAIALGEYPTPGEMPSPAERMQTYLELRAQAIHNPAFREEFTKMSADLVEHLTCIIEDGIEQGVFADVDAEDVANYLVTTIEGINLQRATREDDPTPMLRAMLEDYIEQELLVADDPG